VKPADADVRSLASGYSTGYGTVHAIEATSSGSPAAFLAEELGQNTSAIGNLSPDAPSAVPAPATATHGAIETTSSGWEGGLEAEALALLAAGCIDVWDVLSRRFESKLIQTALISTRGRRIEAAHKLGIGRNTITRKIQELNLE
jgi:two-component system nitrogen regulation response regulator GlnG